MKKHIYCCIIIITFFYIILGCLTVPGGSAVLCGINALGYTDEEFNHEIGRAIFNKEIFISFDSEKTEFSAYFDTQQPDIFIIEGPVYTDIEYSIELATLFSYLGYIRRYYKEDTEGVHIKALEHARKTYEQGKQNYVREAGKKEYTDIRGFGSNLTKLKPKKGIYGVFRWPK